tara:strand:- start:205 stop:861 length:657 start_codon:yes stop_codon:yes gene_type:complete
MSKISLKHSGGNVVSLNSPTSAPTSPDVAFKLPNADGSAGHLIKTDGSGNLSFIAPSETGRKLTYGSWVSVDTQTLVEFTSIAATKEFYIDWSEVGAATNAELGLSIGDTNGYVDSGYHNSCGYLGSGSTSSDTATNRFETFGTGSNAQHRSGRMRFLNMYGNEYVMELFYIVSSEGNIYRWSGTKTTTAAVDRVKFFVIGGGAFDQGYMRYVKVEDL